MDAARNIVKNVLGRGDHDDSTNNPEGTATSGQTSGHTNTLRSQEYSSTSTAPSTGYSQSDVPTTGTALGGRATGNTPDTALHASDGQHSSTSYKSTNTGYAANTALNPTDSQHSSTSYKPTNTGYAADTALNPADSQHSSTSYKPTSTGYAADTGYADTALNPTDSQHSSTSYKPTSTGYAADTGYADTALNPTGRSHTGTGDTSAVNYDQVTDRSSATRPSGVGLVSSETYPQTATHSSSSSKQPGVAAGDTYPKSGDLKRHSHASDTGHHEPTDVQRGERRDPAVVEDSQSKSKLIGSGEDGSHSAVFGLTPDGHKYDDTQHTHGSLKPAHSKHVDDTTTYPSNQGQFSSGGGVADQINDPRVAEKGDGRPATYTTSDDKPGAGW